MTRGQLKIRVARILGIAIGASADVADDTSLLEELANEAVIDVLSRTRVHVRDALITPDVGATEFDVDDTIMRILDIRNQGADLGTPTLAYKEPRVDLPNDGFAFPGATRIQLGAETTGGSLLISYVPTPTPMTDDAHDPAAEVYGRIPAQFHRTLLDYMLWHAADRTGDQGAGRGERYRILYEGKQGMPDPGSDLARIRNFVNTQGGVMITKRSSVPLTSTADGRYWQG